MNSAEPGNEGKKKKKGEGSTNGGTAGTSWAFKFGAGKETGL